MNGALVDLVCVPDAIAPEDRARHFALARELLNERARERKDLAEGYAFRFGPDDFDDVARFVAKERKCCPFADFEIALSRDPAELWLRISGPPGTRAVLQAELSLQSACDC